MTEARTGLRDKAPWSQAGASLKASNGNLLAAELVVTQGWMSGYLIWGNQKKNCSKRKLRRKGEQKWNVIQFFGPRLHSLKANMAPENGWLEY